MELERTAPKRIFSGRGSPSECFDYKIDNNKLKPVHLFKQTNLRNSRGIFVQFRNDSDYAQTIKLQMQTTNYSCT